MNKWAADYQFTRDDVRYSLAMISFPPPAMEKIKIIIVKNTQQEKLINSSSSTVLPTLRRTRRQPWPASPKAMSYASATPFF